MRVEQLHYLAFGIALASIVWLIASLLPSRLARLHLRAPFVALGLGFIVVPGHGELIAAPILATPASPNQPQLLVLGGMFFLFWWAVVLTGALLASRILRAKRRKWRVA